MSQVCPVRRGMPAHIRAALSLFSILMIYACANVGMLESAAVQTFIDAWRDVPVASVRSIMTLSSLVSCPVMIAASLLVGKRVRYRSLMIPGALLCAVGGVLPVFYAPSWDFVLACRVLIGVGTGLLGPRNALLVLSVPPEKRTAYLGYGSTIAFFYTMISGPLGGWLVSFGWQYALLINLVAALTAALLLAFLIEPKPVAAAGAALSATPTADDTTVAAPDLATPLSQGKQRVRPLVWVLALMQLVMSGTKYPLICGLSTVVATHGLGTPALAGLLLSLYSLGAVIGGLLLSWLRRKLRDGTLLVMVLLMAGAMLLSALLPTAITLAVSTFACGLSFCTCIVSLKVLCAGVATQKHMAFATTLLEAAYMLGIFGSNFFITISHAVFGLACDIDSSNLACGLIWLMMGAMIFAARRRLFGAPPTENAASAPSGAA